MTITTATATTITITTNNIYHYNEKWSTITANHYSTEHLCSFHGIEMSWLNAQHTNECNASK